MAQTKAWLSKDIPQCRAGQGKYAIADIGLMLHSCDDNAQRIWC
jgi:hypothetical protein